MIRLIDRVFRETPWPELRVAWIGRALAEAGRVKDIDVFEEVQDHGLGERLTPDGREILRVRGKAFALRPEIHAQRLAEAFEAAKREHETESVAAESIAATTCPQMINGKPCGGALNCKGVCPSCVTGKMGYRYRYTCESCGFDVVTKTELSA